MRRITSIDECREIRCPHLEHCDNIFQGQVQSPCTNSAGDDKIIACGPADTGTVKPFFGEVCIMHDSVWTLTYDEMDGIDQACQCHAPLIDALRATVEDDPGKNEQYEAIRELVRGVVASWDILKTRIDDNILMVIPE